MDTVLSPSRFALNHMAAPGLDLAAFFSLARKLGLDGVEIRNDIATSPILLGTPASEVRADAEKVGLEIMSINALQRFNDWTAERKREAEALADYAAQCGAKALVLVPVNDGSGREEGARQEKLRSALHELKPILQSRSILGFVEPLGFESCSLRSKREALAAVESVGGRDAFRLVHDTFHHHLAEEPELFPYMTGLVHISGVEDVSVALSAMRDNHRVLVSREDRLGNLSQIGEMLRGGYSGFFSFEPFAPTIYATVTPAQALDDSMTFIADSLKAPGDAGSKTE